MGLIDVWKLIVLYFKFSRGKEMKQKLRFLRRRHTDTQLGMKSSKNKDKDNSKPSLQDVLDWSKSFEVLLHDRREWICENHLYPILSPITHTFTIYKLGIQRQFRLSWDSDKIPVFLGFRENSGFLGIQSDPRKANFRQICDDFVGRFHPNL